MIKRIILITLVLISMIACSAEDETGIVTEDQKQIITHALSKKWTASKVMFDTRDVTSEWTNFILEFDQSQKYTATALSEKSVLVWPASGSYTFPKADNPNLILRNDGIEISIADVTEDSAALSFKIAGRSTQARTGALTGQYIFMMKVQ